MGAVYDVEFELRFNGNGRDRFNAKIREYMKKEIPDYTPETDTIQENLKALFPNLHIWEDTENRIEGTAGFNASYSWELVITESFKQAMTECLDGSYLLVYPDSDYDKIVVKDGKVVWVH